MNNLLEQYESTEQLYTMYKELSEKYRLLAADKLSDMFGLKEDMEEISFTPTVRTVNLISFADMDRLIRKVYGKTVDSTFYFDDYTTYTPNTEGGTLACFLADAAFCSTCTPQYIAQQILNDLVCRGELPRGDYEFEY